MTRSWWRMVGPVLAVLVTVLGGSTRDATAQGIKLKLSHFAPTAYNHHANVAAWHDALGA